MNISLSSNWRNMNIETNMLKSSVFNKFYKICSFNFRSLSYIQLMLDKNARVIIEVDLS